MQQALTQNHHLQAVYDEIDKLMSNGESEDCRVDIEVKLHDVWTRIESQTTSAPKSYSETSFSKSKIFPAWSRIAAAVVLITALSWSTYRLLSSEKNTYSEKLVAADEVLYAVLNDGSQVWLAPHSEIAYNKRFGYDNRKVFLSGKAFFDVAHNAEVPFSVTAHDVDVMVKGTAFNVDAFSPDVEIALLRGLVAVKDSRHTGSQEILLYPNQKITLLEQKTTTSDSIHSLQLPVQVKDSIQPDTKWINGTLVFQKQRFADLSKLMEKRFGVIIRINNAKLAEQRFTGVISNENLKQMLDALRQSYPFVYQIKEKQVIVN